MLDLAHWERTPSVRGLLRPARLPVIGTLVGKAMTMAYKLAGKDRYDDFLLERVLGVPFIVTPSVFNPKVPRTGEFLASVLDLALVTRAASWRWTSMRPRFAALASTRD
jgi:hypothetical protein